MPTYDRTANVIILIRLVDPAFCHREAAFQWNGKEQTWSSESTRFFLPKRCALSLSLEIITGFDIKNSTDKERQRMLITQP